MSNEHMTRMSSDGATDHESAGSISGQPTRREILDLRNENANLRKRLTTAEEAASQHAVMLREGNHRIKNSLQLVASLMSVQARREVSAPVSDALRSAAARVSSVAGIHDALQESDGVDSVDLGPVLKKMCTSLQEMAGEDGYIEVHVSADTLMIPVSLAQPIVLAVNELVVNALRHAFPERDKGEINVSLSHADDTLLISVADNGVGLPSSESSHGGYGMTLVNMVIKQIDGELLTDVTAGTKFTIRAPLPSGS